MIIMMILNMSTSYFHKFSFHYFEDYVMTKVTLGHAIILEVSFEGTLPKLIFHPLLTGQFKKWNAHLTRHSYFSHDTYLAVYHIMFIYKKLEHVFMLGKSPWH